MGLNGPATASIAGAQTITVTDSNGATVAYCDLTNSPGGNSVTTKVSAEGTGVVFNGTFDNSGLTGALSYSNSVSGNSNQSLTGSSTAGSVSGTQVSNGGVTVNYTGTFTFYATPGTYTIATDGGTTIVPGVTIQGEGSPSDVGSMFSAGVSFDLAAGTPTNIPITTTAPSGWISASKSSQGASGITLAWGIGSSSSTNIVSTGGGTDTNTSGGGDTNTGTTGIGGGRGGNPVPIDVPGGSYSN